MKEFGSLTAAQVPLAKCRLPNRSAADLPIVDISDAGCMIELRGWPVSKCDRVNIKLPNTDFRQGEVVWVEGGCAGVAFDDLLYEPIVQQLRSLLRNIAK